jgi:hypothetical protein
MKLNKRVLNGAIAAILAGSMGAASAVVDLDAGTGTITFASEATVDPSGTAVNTSAAGAAVVAEIGFSIGDGTSKYVRINLAQPLGAALVAGDFAVNVAGATVTISNGGTAGDAFVIVEIAAVGADIAQDNTLTFDPTDGDEIEVTDQSDYTISFATYEFAANAINQTNALNTASGTWFNWGTGLDASCTAGSPDKIDVTTPTQWLAGGVGAETIFTVTVDDIPMVYTLAGVEVAVVTDYFANGSTFTVSGTMDAFAGGAVNLDGVASTAVDATADTAAWDTAAAAAAGVVVLPLVGVDFELDPDSTTDMTPSQYSMSLAQAGGETFDLGGDVDLGVCGEIVYSGSTDRIDFALTPAGVYPNYLRIVNPSTTDGDVIVQVWNDAGDSVTFNMGNIGPIGSSALAGESSTPLFTIDDVYAAAQAADSSFDANGGKLRIQVRGEFGNDAVDGSGAVSSTDRRSDGIIIQGLTLSLDGGSFFMIKN